MAKYGMVMDLRTCLGCGACIAACDFENETPWEEGKRRTHVPEFIFGEFPNVKRLFVPRLCMHCENPPCVTVCPTGASYINEDGVVLVRYDICIGCKYCAVACPYNARYVDERKRAIDKCTFCYDNRVLQGRQPACVETCVGHARIFGDLEDPNSEVYKLVQSGEAVPLRPDLSTGPKVFYIFKSSVGGE
ncbi:MAG: 4Fe-4S dicluster domain-containing protein [Candidatus Korarchaeota archaeon]|nr:4Fe-4S dicluster domain-containing protein [Candidatus Korarchaeota archaeon]